MSYVPARLGTMRDWHRPMMLNVAIMFTLAGVSAVGMVADDRLILGESVWLKPMKFGFALGVYGLTLAWLLSKLRKGRRTGWWLGTVFAVASVLDVSVVASAAARGTFSHFNQDTDTATRIGQTLFNIGVPPLLLTTLIIAILVLVQRTGDRATTTALRAGLALAVASMGVALWLSNSPDPTRTVVDANGHGVTMNGGHGIGDPDGNAMPLTHWSTTGGDLRVPHFFGLHAIQVLLLLAAILRTLAIRRAWLRDDKVRGRIVGIAALGYIGTFAVLTWQAKRGQALIHLDRQTMIAFAALALATLVATTITVATARRTSARETEAAAEVPARELAAR